MENNVLPFVSAQERAAQKFVDSILENLSDEEFTEWLVRAKQELILQGKVDRASTVIEAGIESRVQRLRTKLECLVSQKDNS